MQSPDQWGLGEGGKGLRADSSWGWGLLWGGKRNVSEVNGGAGRATFSMYETRLDGSLKNGSFFCYVNLISIFKK